LGTAGFVEWQASPLGVVEVLYPHPRHAGLIRVRLHQVDAGNLFRCLYQQGSKVLAVPGADFLYGRAGLATAMIQFQQSQFPHCFQHFIIS
jgi:hypothetical protein